MLNDIKRILFTREDIEEICKKLGEEISRDYENKKLLLVCILKGSAVFAADLMRYITVPCVIDFIALSSYGSSAVSSERVKVNKDFSIDPCGYDVLIVEDILDSGRTVEFVIESMLKYKNPRSVRVCALLDKPSRRVKDGIKADYSGGEVPDAFVVGYGLDYDEKYRNLPFIGELKEEIYK